MGMRSHDELVAKLAGEAPWCPPGSAAHRTRRRSSPRSPAEGTPGRRSHSGPGGRAHGDPRRRPSRVSERALATESTALARDAAQVRAGVRQGVGLPAGVCRRRPWLGASRLQPACEGPTTVSKPASRRTWALDRRAWTRTSSNPSSTRSCPNSPTKCLPVASSRRRQATLRQNPRQLISARLPAPKSLRGGEPPVPGWQNAWPSVWKRHLCRVRRVTPDLPNASCAGDFLRPPWRRQRHTVSRLTL